MIEQRTPEWYKMRIGKFTASRLAALVKRPADKNALFSKTALNCIEKAAAELYYDRCYNSPDSDATRWGLYHERDAIRMLSERTGMQTKELGFVTHPKYDEVGATPDVQLIDAANPNAFMIAQIKCPYKPEYHRAYIDKISDMITLKRKNLEYFWQMQGEMWVTGAGHSYFVSFDPRIRKNDACLHIVRIDRDEAAIRQLEEATIRAIALRNDILSAFRKGSRYPKDLSAYY
jgi:hypothetical protein